MIEIKNVSKSFGTKQVLNNLNLTIKDNSIFGLIGINGAGKSTLLRLLSSVYDIDNGEILFDDIKYKDLEVKKEIFLLPDNPHSEICRTVDELLEFYKVFYDVNKDKFYQFLNEFKFDKKVLNAKTNINKFSKGMQRQVYLCLALSIAPKYLFLDEAFDGLDPLARLTFKKNILNLMEENNMTIIISSHSLRELEDICDCFGLLDGGIIESSGDIESSLNQYHKYQVAFSDDFEESDFNKLDIVSKEKVGKVYQIVCVGEETEIENHLKSFNPIILDKLTIDFEELFILKVKKEGYINYEK
ncbi:MAG: ABC transporter ATP-binding protein [Erysipelotrichaceae bacterium]|nr:ABC transporter ATP-binding protein [Erysipelotrichaceae bacterium]